MPLELQISGAIASVLNAKLGVPPSRFYLKVRLGQTFGSHRDRAGRAKGLVWVLGKPACLNDFPLLRLPHLHTALRQRCKRGHRVSVATL
jgi:hypothetical protein